MASRRDDREGVRSEYLAALAAEVALAAKPETLFAERTSLDIKGRTQALQDGQSALREPLVSAHVAAEFRSVPEWIIHPNTGEIFFVGVKMTDMGESSARVYKVGPCGPIPLDQPNDTKRVNGLHFPLGSNEPAWTAVLQSSLCGKGSKSLQFIWGDDVFRLGWPKASEARAATYHHALHAYVDVNARKHLIDLNLWRQSKVVSYSTKGILDLYAAYAGDDEHAELEYATVIEGHLILVLTTILPDERARLIWWFTPEGDRCEHKLPLGSNVSRDGFLIRNGLLHFVRTGYMGYTPSQLTEDGLIEGNRSWLMPEGGYIRRVGNRVMLIQRMGIGEQNPSFCVTDMLSGLRYGGEEHVIQGEFKDIQLNHNAILLLWVRGGIPRWTRWPIVASKLLEVGPEEALENEWDIDEGTQAERLVVYRDNIGFVVHSSYTHPKLVWSRHSGLTQELRSHNDKPVWVPAYGRFVVVSFGSGTIYVRAYKPPFEYESN